MEGEEFDGRGDGSKPPCTEQVVHYFFMSIYFFQVNLSLCLYYSITSSVSSNKVCEIEGQNVHIGSIDTVIIEVSMASVQT